MTVQETSSIRCWSWSGASILSQVGRTSRDGSKTRSLQATTMKFGLSIRTLSIRAVWSYRFLLLLARMNGSYRSKKNFNSILFHLECVSFFLWLQSFGWSYRSMQEDLSIRTISCCISRLWANGQHRAEYSTRRHGGDRYQTSSMSS